jgi:lipid II:glycine glycyltransferase (peptidoglycan interpeptide bridge formation enzyme)
MQLISIQEKDAWDRFVSKQTGAQFTQSWAWGEFKSDRGHHVIRLALRDDDRILAAGQFIRHPTRLLGGFWYAPRGPVIRHDLIPESDRILAAYLERLEDRVLPGHALFWRIEPPLESKRGGMLPLEWVRAHAYQPASTLLIDLSESEEELLADMHEKTRYNIRLSERKGVTVRVADSDSDIELFLAMNEETSRRDQFRSQSTSYIRATYQALHPKRMARIRIAELGGTALAASMEIVYGDTVTYLYGASASESRAAMAPYALHWDAIRSAKQDGSLFYDFYGINPADESSPYFKPSWRGITRFKLGWGGHRADYVGTWELPRRPLLYRIMRTIRR